MCVHSLLKGITQCLKCPLRDSNPGPSGLRIQRAINCATTPHTVLVNLVLNQQSQIWDESEHPWIDLVAIQLTTVIPLTALCRTYFNIVDKPSCLRFGQPASVSDPLSYQYVVSAMLTRYEIEHLGRAAWATDQALSKAIARRGKITHYVTLCTATVRDTKPRVDVYITLIGRLGWLLGDVVS